MPHFAGRQVADIDSPEVRTWFAALGATPVAADRSMPVLSVIMKEAEAMGLRPEGSNLAAMSPVQVPFRLRVMPEACLRICPTAQARVPSSR